MTESNHIRILLLFTFCLWLKSAAKKDCMFNPTHRVQWAMEEKLQSYRLRKRRTEQIESIKEKFNRIMNFTATSATSEKPPVNIEISVSCSSLQFCLKQKSFLTSTIIIPEHTIWTFRRQSLPHIVRLRHQRAYAIRSRHIASHLDHILHLARLLSRVDHTLCNCTRTAVWRRLLHPLVSARHLSQSTWQKQAFERDQRLQRVQQELWIDRWNV